MSKETENRQREPLARVIKRAEMPAGKIALLRLMAVFLSLIAGGFLSAVWARTPLSYMERLFPVPAEVSWLFRVPLKL